MKNGLRTWLLQGALALAVAAPAMAADMPLKAPRLAAPAFSWTGFYLGGNVGGAWGTYDIVTAQTIPGNPFFTIDANAVSAAASPSIQPNSFIGGGQAGFNMQTGNVVVGIEVDFDALALSAANAQTLPFPSTLPGGPIGPPTLNFSTSESVSTEWLFTARPRLGWAANNLLLYVTGGLAVGNEKFTQAINLLVPFVETTTFSTTRTGWAVGGGLEYAVTRNWSVKGEFLHVDLGSVNFAGTIAPPAAGFTNPGSVRLKIDMARAGINYHL
jgi:outer membrane immunogenic protein